MVKPNVFEQNLMIEIFKTSCFQGVTLQKVIFAFVFSKFCKQIKLTPNV